MAGPSLWSKLKCLDNIRPTTMKFVHTAYSQSPAVESDRPLKSYYSDLGKNVSTSFGSMVIKILYKHSLAAMEKS